MYVRKYVVLYVHYVHYVIGFREGILIILLVLPLPVTFLVFVCTKALLMCTAFQYYSCCYAMVQRYHLHGVLVIL